jgi:adenylate cyclase
LVKQIDLREKMPSVRRLAAILAADVVGYSRLMGADEEGTLERLKAHRRELVDPKIREHRGRIVKTTGDGMLVEFASVVDAVRCAAELQRAMIDREAGMPEDRRIRFRIGINLGDIIVDGDDIFGDGVNVAARLEALAEPGGICVSRTVRDQIRDKLPYSFEDMGEQSVKNIARPVRVYALRPETIASLPVSSLPPATAI